MFLALYVEEVDIMERKNHDMEDDGESSESLKYSPLFHVRTTLKVLRTLSGFPILPANSKWDNFVFIPSKEYPRLFIILILFSLPINTLLYFFYDNLNALTLMLNVSKLDYFVEICCLFFLPFCFNGIYFISFKNNTSLLNSICEEISNINYRQDHYHGSLKIHSRAKEKVEQYILLFMMMGVLIAALFGISGFIAFEFDDGEMVPNKYKALLAATLPIIMLLGPISHIVSSGDFIIIYLILHLTQNLVCLRTRIEDRKMEKKRKTISTTGEVGNLHRRRETNRKEQDENAEIHDELSTMVDIALDIGNAIEKVNNCFSSMLFCYFGGNLLIATSSFYLAVNYLFISPYSALDLGWGLWSTVCFILYMGRLYLLTTSGHELGQEMMYLKQTMMSFVSVDNHDVKLKQCETNNFSGKFDLMISILDNNAPISPYGYFSVNGGSFLSASATIVTYLIVLIQFKISE